MNEGSRHLFAGCVCALILIIAAPAKLLAQASPSISQQPQSQTLLAGTNAVFSVTASGQSLHYQWSFNGTNLANSTHVAGATTAILTISNIASADNGTYRVVVTNTHGSITSSNATLAVLSPPAITTQPVSVATNWNSTISFTVAASGSSQLGYQWYFNNSRLSDAGRVTGASTTNLTLTNAQMSDVGSYQVVVTNAYGAITSAPATLLLVPLAGWGANFFGEQDFPSSLTNVMAIATADANISFLNLMLKADSSVIGWGQLISGSGNSVIPVPAGLSNAVAIAAGHQHGLLLQRDTSVLGFGTNTSGEANPPAGLSNVVQVAAGDGWSAALKNDGTVVAWGDNTYGETNVTPGLSNVLAISAGGIHGLALRNDGTVVGWGYNPFGEAASPAGLSNVVAISAGYYHDLALKSDGSVVAWGDSLHGEADVPPGLSNVTAVAASFTLSLALRNDGTVAAWGDNFYGQSTPPPGLSNIVAIAAGGEYGLALLGNPATRVPPSILWQGATNNVVPTGGTLSFVPLVTGSLPRTYQWFFNGSQLPGETNQWLMLSSIQPSQAGTYQFIVSNSYGSATGQVATIVESPGIITQPADQSVLGGATANFSATIQGIPPLQFQWYFNGAPLSDDGRISGSTSTNLIISNVQSNDAGAYVLVVTNDYGSTVSQPATLTFLVPATITSQPGDASVLLSSNASFSASATGTPPLSYQWYLNGAPLSDSVRISGSASNILSIASVQGTDSGPYVLVVTNAYGSATSSVANLTVLVPAFVTMQPSNQSALLNSTASFTAAAAGTLPLTYQWYLNGAALTDSARVTGSTSTNLVLSNLQSNDFGSYQLLVTNNYGSATSTIVSLILLSPPSIALQPTNRAIPVSSNVSFAISAGGTVPLSYTWYFNGTLLTNGGRISGATNSTLAISSATTNDSGSYQAIVTNNYGAATSALAVLTVQAPIQITSHPASLALLQGSNASFTVGVAGSAPVYHWYFNGAPLFDGGRISGSTNPTLSIASIQSGDAGGYTCLVTNLFSAVSSRQASLTVLTNLGGSVRYVNLNNTNPAPPYLDWTTAATNIQDAVDAAVAGDSVVVSNGTYGFGGRAVYGVATNRVTIDKALVLQSLNGPGLTTIQGFNTSPATIRPGRCVYMTNGAVLAGFTLTSGNTTTGDVVLAQSGGGVWCESSSALISNCVITGNSAIQAGSGGGAFRGTLMNCVLSNNIAPTYGGGGCSNVMIGCVLFNNLVGRANNGGGGGASYSSLSNCLLVANTCPSFSGGGAFACTLNSCVLSNNSAGTGGGVGSCIVNASLISSNRATYGGGAFSNTLNNCILLKNSASVGGGAYNSSLFNCTVVSNTTYGVWGGTVSNSIVYFNASGNIIDSKSVGYTCAAGFGTITNDPQFVNVAAGDFHLRSTSPCINSGYNRVAPTTTDFDGNPRIAGGAVDMGAYEFQPLGRDAFNAWLQQYGLPTDGSATYADSDHDGLNNLQEWIAGSVPTNAGSGLRLLSVTPAPAGVVILWQSVSNRAYFIERSADLTARPAFSLIATNLPGSNNVTSYNDTTATGPGPFYYRVGVQTDSNHLYTPFSVLSYAWLQQYRLPTDGTADFADTDGDGMNNWQEWIAGTNPTNATSVLTMVTPLASTNSGAITVKWQSVNTRTYYLQRSTNLAAQPPFSSIRSNIIGLSGTTSVTDTNPPSAAGIFYRVGIQ